MSAVALTLTAISPSANGGISLAPGDATFDRTQAAIAYNVGDTISNSAMVAVHADGNIKVISGQTVNLLIDVQGYFTSGSSTAAGGFVPVNAARIVNTNTGLGAPQATVANGSSVTIQATGVGGVPATASSVYVNVTIQHMSAAGYVRAWPYGGTDPGTGSLTFGNGGSTAQSAPVKLSSSGKFVIGVITGGPVDIIVDVQGYFVAGSSTSTFTPAAVHLFDSRVPAQPLQAGETRKIQVTGKYGIPTAGSGIDAMALNLRTVWTSTPASGYLTAYPDDQAMPATSNLNYGSTLEYRSDLAIVSPGADGSINVYNGGNGPIDLVIDVEGWFGVNLIAATGSGCNLSGDRADAKSISHSLTDRSKVVYSPLSGNLLATGQLLNVAGIGQDTTVVWRYNAMNDARPTLDMGYDEAALVLNSTDQSLTYTAPDGGCYQFPQVDATDWGTPTSPAGINALITEPSTGTYDLKFFPSGLVEEFTDNGDGIHLTSTRDKYSNTITYDYGTGGGRIVSITDVRGKTVHFAYTDVHNPTQPSTITDDSLGRTISIAYNGPNGAMTQITDATGAHTSFGYNASGVVSSITDDRGSQTSFGYDSGQRLTGWTYATGTTDASSWTANYASATQTKITDPNSHTATYDLNTSTHTITITDANNNKTSTAFDGHDNELSSTSTLNNTDNPSKYTWGPGNNMLLTATSPAGSAGGTAAKISYTYPGATSGSAGGGVLANYQPSDSTDSQTNKTTYGYSTVNGNSNARDVSSTTTPNGAGGTPTSHRQGDNNGTACGAFAGELCSSTNGNGKTTSYTYDALGRVTVLTRPAPLGAINFTYDGANRVTSATDGRGNTAYYTYDADDRQTQISYSASSCPAATCVTYAYDGDGNKTSRVAATGTTGYGYDRLNRPISRTFNAATVSTATYDGASNMTSFTDAAGTVQYAYDAGDQLVLLAQPGGSCPSVATYKTSYTSPNSTKCTRFDHTTDNRRQEVYYPNGQRIILQYFNSGRVKQIQAVNSGGGVLASRTYTYSNTSGADTGLRDSVKDDVSGLTTRYSYDGMNRLTAANDGTTAYSAGYDQAGNRLSYAKTGTSSSYAAYNDADEQCFKATVTGGSCTAPPSGASVYSYDTSGNQTVADGNTLNYNLFNQFTSIQIAGVTTAFTYNDIDNTERASAASTNFLNGNLGVTAQTTSGATIEYTRDPYGNLIAMSASGSDYYYTPDAIGSIILLTNSSQTSAASYSYDPWGRINTSTGSQASTNPWRYAGGYYDTTTGLTKMGARYYEPRTGRFTQPDPSHQEQNNYTYAGDDPINRTDPSGLCSIFDEGLDCVVSTAETYAAPLITATLSLTIAGIGVAACTSVIGCAFGGFLVAAGGAGLYGAYQQANSTY